MPDDSEVDAYHWWLFSVSPDDPPVGLVRSGNVQDQSSLSPNPKLKHPWWYRIAPTWAKRLHQGHCGLMAGTRPGP